MERVGLAVLGAFLVGLAILVGLGLWPGKADPPAPSVRTVTVPGPTETVRQTVRVTQEPSPAPTVTVTATATVRVTETVRETVRPPQVQTPDLPLCKYPGGSPDQMPCKWIYPDGTVRIN